MAKLVGTMSCFFHILLLIICVVEGAGGTRRSVGRTLFVFGDSLFDAGNNQYIDPSSSSKPTSNSWPYGQTFFHHPTGRYSDGRLVPDFIAELAGLPILPPYLQPGLHHFTDGANFASAGSSVITRPNPPHRPDFLKIDLLEQLSHFKEMVTSMRHQLGNEHTKEVLGRAVYLFSSGGNDYFSTTRTMPNATHSMRVEYVDTVIGNLTSVVTEIYNMGGRKIAFQNVGPLGCTPGQKATNPELTNWCNDELSAFARLHNEKLMVTLKTLSSQLYGFKYSIFDYYNALKYMIVNPVVMGFKKGQSACCGVGPFRGTGCGSAEAQVCSNPSEYVWFDGAHTTEAANQILAQLIWSGHPATNVTAPYTVAQLFTLPHHR